MRRLTSVLRYLRRSRAEEDLHEELQHHIERQIELYVRSGMSESEARNMAQKEFGGMAQTQEECRQARTGYWLEAVLKDIRFGARILLKQPGFTAVVVATLALGIGANTAVFSIIDAVMLRALPYKDPERLVAVWRHNPKVKDSKLPDRYGDFQRYQQHARSLDSVSAATWFSIGALAMTGRGAARPVRAVLVDASFFHTLGVQASLGRTFARDDEKRGCSVVLTHGFWQDTLGGDPGIAGQQLTIDHRPCAVLGVMARGFGFYPPATEMWMLLGPDFRPRREQMGVGIFARLAPGVTAEQAQSELRALYETTDQGPPGSEPELVPVVYELKGELTWLASPTLRPTLVALSGAVLFVLLIACVNVASLLLGRSAARERELVVRAALGAARYRLVRQLLTEGFLMSLAGSALGVVVAFGAIRYFRHANPVELPVGADIALHTPVLVFTAGLSIVTTLLFALIPALRASRIDLNQAVKTGGRGAIHGGTGRRLAGSLIVAEVALSVALLAGAGLLIESVLRIGIAPLGFDPERLVSMKLSLPEESYRQPARQRRFSDELRQRIASIPGVEGAALINWTLREGQRLEVAGQPREPRQIGTLGVTPSWLAVMKVPLLHGRFFTERDLSNSAPVAVINEKLARHNFPGVDPIGQQVRYGQPGGESPWLTIVGVVGNVRDTNYNWNMQPVEQEFLYRPFEQASSSQLVFAVVVRTKGVLEGVEEAMRHEVNAVDLNVPVYDLQTWSSRLSKDLAYPRFRALIFGGFAGFALILAAVGLYGVLGQSVAQRRQEFAVRMAVGASSATIFRLVARQGGIPVVVGVVIGVSAAVALARAIASLLYGVRPAEPLTLIGVSVVLLAVAGVAIALPALRAASVDPMAVLRDE